ncbi:MAG: lysophospholipid acyltransferase family protein [Pirellulales bacterium]
MSGGKKKQRHFPRLRNFGMKLSGLLAAKGIAAWMQTLDMRAAFYDRSVDPIHGDGGPRIYVFWHEYILLPLAIRGNCRLSMLLSQHGDADILARIAGHFGFDCVRGSTYRGGARALWELEERSRTHHLTITPDGPRGPRRQLAQGPIYLASRLQIPIVPMGFGYDRPWRTNSWDRFAVPRMFSRARAVIGPAVSISPDLDRTRLENCRLRTERLLNCLTAEAEAWAVAGSRKAGEIVVRRHSAPSPPTRARAVPIQPAILPSRAA